MKINIIGYTFINIAVIETVFFVAELLIKKKNLLIGFITNLFLGLIVFLFSFFEPLYYFFEKLIKFQEKTVNIVDILSLFFNMFYGYWRGGDRIAKLNKKYGNL